MRFQIQVIQRRLFFLLELSYPMLKLNSQQWPRANDFPSSKPLFHQQIFVRFRIKIYSYYFQHDNTYPGFIFIKIPDILLALTFSTNEVPVYIPWLYLCFYLSFPFVTLWAHRSSFNVFLYMQSNMIE